MSGNVLPPPPVAGLTTKEAFDKLIDEISTILQNYVSQHGRNWAQVVRSSFSTRSKETTLCWCSVLVLFIESILVIAVWTNSLLQEGLIMLFLSIIVSGLIIWENYKRLNELPVKIENLLLELKELTPSLHWDETVYPDLYMPISPCITLQWCYRDGSLINLPWPLLVPGDIIVLNPSQKVAAKCELITTEVKTLQPGETFIPTKKEVSVDDIGSPEPKLHSQLEPTFAVVLESPYKSVVEEALHSHLNRPASFYTKERHILLTRTIECIVLPLGLMIFFGLSFVRMLYLPRWLGINIAPLPDILILQPLTCTFPLIPLALPVIVSFLHAIGNAKLYILLNTLKKSCSKTEVKVQLGFRYIYREAWKFFIGREEVLHRSGKILHILATVTALCCVDKKGVLSWPNPTADQILFLRSNIDPRTKKRETVQEVLDITHDNINAFELHFDEPTWERHLPNLKPLGLNILLNTCNYNIRSTYALFHSHIIQELHANVNDVVVPVTARRCLCELARIIGFTDKAAEVFKLEQELCCYRHIESDEACRTKLNKARIKFPFPHMMSAIVREKACQGLQLMSQGTGDMILDVCDDFWDGFDLRPLTDVERKIILDFYQRTSLTSVCGAFAYKPILSKMNAQLASLYLELPPSQGNRYLPYYSLSVEDGHFSTKDSSISSDCLYNLSEKRRSSEKEISDIDGCIDIQTKQVFIGMVAMQYEASVDMVQLVEQLDQACVRFVHFSKENELRSRLFSEKMGLESGWNCHISLSSGPEDDERELSIEQASLLLGNESRSLRRATLASLRKARNVESIRKRRLTSCSSEVAEESNLLGRCSTSVPEMANLSTFADDDEDLLDDNDADKANKEEERSMQLPAVSFSDAEPDSTIRETPVGSFAEAYENKGHRTPLGIDMSNRAKLPKGIEEIRHHLEHDIDNVPLLVSLFTDCTAETSRAMIKIMQEYGEVILLLGAATSIDNPGLFLQADASLALEPMYPQACRKYETFIVPKTKCVLPTEIGVLLSSLSCSFLFKREDVATIYPLIAQARHFMNNCSRNSLQFWLSCQLSLAVLGLLGLIVLLPPLFVLSDIIWLTCFIVPLLALTLSFATMGRVDDDIMEQASWKNHFRVNRSIFTYAIWFYGMKFLPSLLNVVMMSVFNLRWICQSIGNGTCSWVYPALLPVTEFKHSIDDQRIPLPQRKCITNWYCGDNADKLLFAQQYILFFVVLYFTLISSCFLHRWYFIWVRNPIFNRIWSLTSVGVIILQCIYSAVRLRFASSASFSIIPIASYAWAFSWAIILLGLNELLRRQEIKMNIRYQKRARLDFGTKLGMNSPF